MCEGGGGGGGRGGWVGVSDDDDYSIRIQKVNDVIAEDRKDSPDTEDCTDDDIDVSLQDLDNTFEEDLQLVSICYFLNIQQNLFGLCPLCKLSTYCCINANFYLHTKTHK